MHAAQLISGVRVLKKSVVWYCPLPNKCTCARSPGLLPSAFWQALRRAASAWSAYPSAPVPSEWRRPPGGARTAAPAAPPAAREADGCHPSRRSRCLCRPRQSWEIRVCRYTWDVENTWEIRVCSTQGEFGCVEQWEMWSAEHMRCAEHMGDLGV